MRDNERLMRLLAANQQTLARVDAVLNGADGMADWFHQVNDELRKYMAFTGCRDLRHLDASVLHFTR